MAGRNDPGSLQLDLVGLVVGQPSLRVDERVRRVKKAAIEERRIASDTALVEPKIADVAGGLASAATSSAAPPHGQWPVISHTRT